MDTKYRYAENVSATMASVNEDLESATMRMATGPQRWETREEILSCIDEVYFVV